ncbi:unnamed protein product [Anisakis simplex]|uniref:Uncharacterized protein n=1 Tax=Anisakis simplex TaxID=6269 RepID=A0A3P6SUB9_ANISI|nr:unnamed protein product [Anisakis simplex]
MFSKKLRFSAGDDASKLPTAIANFGELTVSLPQFAGRYLPLEQSYLPRPIRIGYESDNYKYSSRRSDFDDLNRTQNDDRRLRYGLSRNVDDDNNVTSIRYRRRQQLEEEVWNRLRTNNADAGQLSPGIHNHSPAHLRQASSDDTSLNEKVAHIRAEHEKRRQRNRTIAADQSHPEIAQAINNNLIVPITTDQSSPQELKSAGSSSSTTHSSEESDNDPLPIVTHPAPNRFRIICRSTSEQQTPNFIHAASIQQTSNGIQTSTNNATSNNTPIQKQESLNETSSRPDSAASSTRRNSSATQPPPQTPPPQPIPIVHYPGEIPAWIMKRRQRYQRSKTNPDILIALSQINCNNTNSTNIPTTTSPSSPSINNTRIQQLLAERANRLDSTTQRYVPLPPSLYSSDSADNNTSFDNDTNNVISSPTSKTSYQQQPIPPDRRARFRRRAFAMAAEREASNEARLEHKMLPSKFLCTVDYQSKCRPRCVFGKKGSKEGDLNWPRGVTAISGTNEFAVCDSSNHRICIFNTQGRLIRSFGKYGSGNGELDSAAGICSNRLKQLIVSDRYNHRIVVFDLNGQFIRAFGSHGPSNGRFNNPWGVCVDEAGMIYAVDKDNHRVQVFDPNGQFVSKFGSMGSGPGQLHNPQFIAYHKQSQHLYVTDSSNHRICVFDHNGNAVLQFGQEGFHNGQLKFPRGIAVDDQGFVIVADSGNNRVQIFYPNGRFMHCFGTWGVGAGQLKGLEDIALLDHTIVVSDRENHRIQLF